MRPKSLLIQSRRQYLSPNILRQIQAIIAANQIRSDWPISRLASEISRILFCQLNLERCASFLSWALACRLTPHYNRNRQNRYCPLSLCWSFAVDGLSLPISSCGKQIDLAQLQLLSACDLKASFDYWKELCKHPMAGLKAVLVYPYAERFLYWTSECF